MDLRRASLLLLMHIFAIGIIPAQSNLADSTAVKDTILYFAGGISYHPPEFKPIKQAKNPKNIIFLIGDGMGLSHITAARVANGGKLYLDQFPVTGLNTTFSASDFVTDSGAGGTALATGEKTLNGAIGVDRDSVIIPNIREVLSGSGKSTGVVVTCAVTHATPAAFVAHQPSREMKDEIAMDFMRSGIDLFMGGGLENFIVRGDSANLLEPLVKLGYFIDTQTVAPQPSIRISRLAQQQKVAGLYAAGHMETFTGGRGNYLPEATQAAIEVLKKNPYGFFLMVEGSQIDWGGHANHTGYIITETMDFDRAVGEALRFAAADGQTLVVVTADHETGGMALMNGNYQTGMVRAAYTTGDHSGTMVPVFAFGPGSELFRGIYDNTDVPRKILEAMKLSFPKP
ncbi:MAG TPA: alkaline phosphatase [Bacteroidales bacterium]|nr:alkaline phosphatase [Bacteroidales bacterium]HRZ49403.1 alkaline phosphatase [Bacteroidales bacterium]